jgi:small-conductance mechanosensitive channel
MVSIDNVKSEFPRFDPYEQLILQNTLIQQCSEQIQDLNQAYEYQQQSMSDLTLQHRKLVKLLNNQQQQIMNLHQQITQMRESS